MRTRWPAVRRRLLAASGVLAAAALLSGPARGERVIRIEPELLTEQLGAGGEGGGVTYAASERGQLRDMAQEWRKRVQENNLAIADELLPDLKRLLSLPGYHERGTLLGGFVIMGRDWTLLEDWQRAEKAYEAAIELDPDHAPAHLGLGDLALERDGGIRGLLGVAGAAVRSALAGLGDRLSLLRLAANALLVFVVAAAVTVGGLSVVLMAKYNRLLRHGVREFLSERVPEGFDGVIAWAIVFLPIALFLSPPWWAVYWLVVFRPYGTRAERRLCVVGLVVLVLLAPAFHVVTRLSELQRDPVLRAARALEEAEVDPQTLDRMRQFADRVRAPEASFLLGALLESAGRADAAIDAYGEASELGGGFARAIVNRGNIHFRLGDRGSALADYKQATDADRRLALAWRNGSVAYAQDLKADEAGQWLRRAQEIDSSAVSRWSEEEGQSEMVDAGLTTGEIVGLMLDEQASLLPGLIRALLSPPAIAGLLGLIFTFFVGSRVLSRFEAAACEKCGRAFCSRCHASAKTSSYCTQCTHLYVKKDGVSPVVRSAKLREVNRWVAINSLATRFFNIILPGAGSFYADRPIAGVLLVFLWASALAGLLLPARLLQETNRIGQEDLMILFGLELAVLVVVYLVALVQSLRHGD